MHWTEAGGGLEAGESSVVTLVQGLYGHTDKKDGWYVHDRSVEVEALLSEMVRLESSMQARKEAEFLFIDPKAEL